MVTWTDAQAGVIGSVLLEPQLAPKAVAITSAADYSGEFRSLFQAICDLVADGTPVDAMTVAHKVGPAYTELIKQILSSTPTSAHFDAYCGAVQETSRLAKIHSMAAELADAKSIDEAADLIAKASAITVRQSRRKIYSMTDMLTGFYLDHEGSPKEYVSWGIDKLDANVFADLGDVVVLGGYPSDGKSAMMLQMAYHMGSKHKVGIFSFETGKSKLADRLVSHAGQISMSAIKKGMSAGDWRSLTSASTDFTHKGVEVIEAAGYTVPDIIGTTISRQYDVIFVDYVQLIIGSGKRYGSRNDEVAEISRSMAVMARRYGVLTVLLSQLSRPESKSGKIPPPTMRSLRESGQLEQDADVIMLLYRTDPAKNDSPRKLIVAKNKEGQLGQIPLLLDGPTQTFRVVGEKKITDPQQATLWLEQRKRQEVEKAGGKYKPGFKRTEDDEEELP